MSIGIRIRFIDTAKSWWRMWSIRFTALGTALYTYLIASPDVVLQAWNFLPNDAKSFIPTDYALWIPAILMVLGMFSRVVKQEKIPDPKVEDGTPKND